MTEDDIKKIIAEALETTPDVLDAQNEDTWNSIKYISVLIALDDAFSGKVADVKGIDEARSMKSLLALLRQNELVE